MMDREPNASVGFPNSEASISVAPGKDDILDGGSEPPLDVDAGAVREQTVARLRLLWEQRRFLFRITALGLVVATAIAFAIPKLYTSTTRLMPPDQQSGSSIAMAASMLSKLGGVGTLGSGLLSLKTPSQLFIGVLRSRTVQDELITRFDLRKVYKVRYWEDARKVLAHNTGISEDTRTGIITISVTDRNPQLAAAMAQEYVADLNRLINELTTSSAHRERVFLEGRLKEVKQDLENAEKDFGQFASKNTVINVPEQGKAMVQAAATLQGQLIAAESELKGLREIYTGNNVRVRSLQARVAELRKQLDKLGGTASGEQELGNESPYPPIRKLPLLGVPYADLYRKVKVEEAVFEALTQEYELVKVEEAKEIPVVRVLDVADVPERKSFPPRLLILVLGVSLALTVGAIWVLGSAHWASVDEQDPRKVLALEVYETTMRTQVLGGFQNGWQWRAVKDLIWRRRRPSSDK